MIPPKLERVFVVLGVALVAVLAVAVVAFVVLFVIAYGRLVLQ